MNQNGNFLSMKTVTLKPQTVTLCLKINGNFLPMQTVFYPYQSYRLFFTKIQNGHFRK